MPNVRDYQFKLDQYHNNYVNVQTITRGLDDAKAASNQSQIDFYGKMAQRVITEEAEYFRAGVAAAGGDAKKFLADVMEHYPDMKDSPQYQARLCDVNAQHASGEQNAEKFDSAKTNYSKLPFAADTTDAVIAVSAAYKEAYNHINDPSFNYLTEVQKRDYADVYTSAKLQQNAALEADPELGYSSFRSWAVKADLHEEDWVKLDPTPVTQNHIKLGLSPRGIPDPLKVLERAIFQR